MDESMNREVGRSRSSILITKVTCSGELVVETDVGSGISVGLQPRAACPQEV
jgi:hypothetical protein